MTPSRFTWELLKTVRPQNIGVFVTSAGGSLTLTTLLRAKMENVPSAPNRGPSQERCGWPGSRESNC
jgi:hypothetical protein